ncbi:hypothetical protein CEUSTIGMA_g13189.t1 [Chlamydomonas eustigma]|uniref:AAA+ ATPase domain-containing protein n=1 Tax=Chlamydomonas eustigma TaxID=1157962 RepID=A0A250XRU4_9CHLO|nr:hypothetical protein CEUSTIGMA_g13189.t1 [Chlamydomonas eustigma]|eukprot:GAX85774.1 hypothetical protein CEUSTIGMA_g13189.t1 [Chlamydomonas eustigma]
MQEGDLLWVCEVLCPTLKDLHQYLLSIGMIKGKEKVKRFARMHRPTRHLRLSQLCSKNMSRTLAMDEVNRINEETSVALASVLAECSKNAQQLGKVRGVSPHQHLLREKLKRAIALMQEGLVEKEEEVRLLLLAAVCGEHILLIGPPGTAKSEVGRRLCSLFSGTYFERLLTRFSVPEELFGPLSMRALEEDKYERQTRGYLPEAEVAFIDEIFKANSAILNTLLSLMNERVFDNGCHRVSAPLITLVGASNELPDSDELQALFDRFLLRKPVKQMSAEGLVEMLKETSSAGRAFHGLCGSVDGDDVAEKGQDERPGTNKRHPRCGVSNNGVPTTEAVSSSPTEAVSSSPTEAVSSSPTEAVSSSPTEAVSSSPTEAASSSPNEDHHSVFSTMTLESATTPAPDHLLTKEELASCKEGAIRTVLVPLSVIRIMADLRQHIQEGLEPKTYVSDRRMAKAVQLLQVAAYCDGRTVVSREDLLMLKHVLWQDPQHVDKVYDWLLKQVSADSGFKQLDSLFQSLFLRMCESLESHKKLSSIQREASMLKDVALDQYTEALRALNAMQNLEHGSSACSLWFGVEEAEALSTYMQAAVPKAVETLGILAQQFLLLETMLRLTLVNEKNGAGRMSSSDVVLNVRMLAPLWSHLIPNSVAGDVNIGGHSSSVPSVKHEDKSLHQKMPADLQRLFEDYTKDPLNYVV